MPLQAGGARHAQGSGSVGSICYLLHDTNDRAWLVAEMLELRLDGFDVTVKPLPLPAKWLGEQTVTIEANGMSGDAISAFVIGKIYPGELDFPDPVSVS